MTRHFLSLDDLQPGEIRQVVARARELKRMQAAGEVYEPLRNRTLALIFEKSSTRTRLSFEAGITQLGGNAIFLAPGESHLDRGEPVSDTARVLSSMVDAVVIRTGPHERVESFARHATIPVVNGLTDRFHPCQLLADVQAYAETRGDITGRKVAWVGDGNNVCHSWMNAARALDFRLSVATPPGYEPRSEVAAGCPDASLTTDPAEAVAGADVVVTDAWASMGQESEKDDRVRAFGAYQVDEALMSLAAPEAVFMHCLPAYRGYEVTAEVIDGPRSVVWVQAANRLHAQKALLEFLLC